MDDKDLNDLRRLAAEEGADSVQVAKDREFVAFATAMEGQQAHAGVERAVAKRVEAWADLLGAVDMAIRAAVIVGVVYAINQAVRAWFG